MHINEQELVREFMETLHGFVKASRMPPPQGKEARMTDMLVVGHMMDYFERHPETNTVATGELGKELGFTKPMLTHILDRLEQNGVVLRTQSQTDRRVTLLSFSESGVSQFRKDREQALARIRRILERFGYEDVRVLLTLLRRLELPEHLTANGLLAVLNACYGAGEAEEILFSEAPAAAGREAEEKKEKIFPKTP